MTAEASGEHAIAPRLSDDSTQTDVPIGLNALPTSLPDVERELARLERLPTIELSAEYLALHGKPPRSRHRMWLVRQLAFALQERRLGGLSGVAHTRLGSLMAQIALPGERPAPASPQIIGALRGSARDAVHPTIAVARPPRDPQTLRPGTVLIKRWRDRELRLTALDDGRVDVDGATFNSLSAAARAITGTRWNGRAFFGLAERRTAK